MKRGRKPTPTKLKLVRGNPGNRPLPENEPKPDLGIPDCPDHLSEIAKEEWKSMSGQLYRLGLMTRIDRAALAGYCQSYGRWVEAEKEAVVHGLVVKTKSGNLIQNPYLGIANRALKQMHIFLIEFGMTPSSRTRVTAARDGNSDTNNKSKYFAPTG